MQQVRTPELPTVPLAHGKQRAITARVMLETCGLWLALAVAACWLHTLPLGRAEQLALYGGVLLAQALVLQRIYIVAHEASHRKLDANARVNDALGQLVLLAILVPLQVYRKIHIFHHGFNRKDIHTSALDVFVSPWPVTPAIRAACSAVWFAGIFAGGFFVHSLVSIVLFLCLPARVAQRISPAFRNWSSRDRAIAWAQFGCAALLQLAVALALGRDVWLYAFGLPLLAFAWIWSLTIYVFHYNTTLGEHVRFNVRAIRAGRFTRWLWLNFNQHATHHMYPNVPRHALPSRVAELPGPFAARNDTAASMWRAVLGQLRGPQVVYRRDHNPLEHLFVAWED